MPGSSSTARLCATEPADRGLPADVRAVIDLVPPDAHPMLELRTAVSLVGASDLAGAGSVLNAGGTPEENLARSIRLFAALPAIVTYGQRRRLGLEPVQPRDDLDYSANFLWMTFGEESGPVVVDAFNRSMILCAEHSFDASTFTGRVIMSALSDLYSAVVGAIGTLKGPLHGGANEAVLHIFDEIESADNAASWLDRALAEKRKVMGFGDRVHKRGGSRGPTMKAALDMLVAHYQQPDVLALYDALESESWSARASTRTSTTRPARPTTSSGSTLPPSPHCSWPRGSRARRRTSWSRRRRTGSPAGSRPTTDPRSAPRSTCNAATWSTPW